MKPSSSLRCRIIGLGLLALTLLASGCSSVRVAYGNAPQLSWWWLDGYLDFSREQTPAAKQAIERWFDWHRTTQLPEVQRLLAQARTQVDGPVTAAQACRWQTRVREQLEPALQRAIGDFAEFVPGLGEPQFRQLQRKYERNLDDMRDDFLHPDPRQRLQRAVERTVERAERLYGRLDPAQRKLVAEGVEASPFDPELWLTERRRRQRDTLTTLQRLVAERADRTQRVAALRELAQRTERSPDPTYRAYQLRLTDYNCALAARLHNATTAAQRQTARERLQGWEDDVKALAAPSGPPGAVNGLPPG